MTTSRGRANPRLNPGFRVRDQVTKAKGLSKQLEARSRAEQGQSQKTKEHKIQSDFFGSTLIYTNWDFGPCIFCAVNILFTLYINSNLNVSSFPALAVTITFGLCVLWGSLGEKVGYSCFLSPWTINIVPVLGNVTPKSSLPLLWLPFSGAQWQKYTPHQSAVSMIFVTPGGGEIRGYSPILFTGFLFKTPNVSAVPQVALHSSVYITFGPLSPPFFGKPLLCLCWDSIFYLWFLAPVLPGPPLADALQFLVCSRGWAEPHTYQDGGCRCVLQAAGPWLGSQRNSEPEHHQHAPWHCWTGSQCAADIPQAPLPARGEGPHQPRVCLKGRQAAGTRSAG